MPDPTPYTQVDLTPVAQPTNQFHYPEVRKSLAGSQLAQVAQALAQVEPKAQAIVDHLQQNDIQKQQQMGAAVFADLKEQNRQGFMQAVKNGDISYRDTPFAYEYIDRATAQAEAQSTVNKIRSDYLQNQDLHVDSMQPYSDMFDSQASASLQGQSPIAAAEMGKIYAAAKPQLMSEHVQMMSEQRPQVMQAALEANLAQGIAPIDQHLNLLANGHLLFGDQLSSSPQSSTPSSSSPGEAGDESQLWQQTSGQSQSSGGSDLIADATSESDVYNALGGESAGAASVSDGSSPAFTTDVQSTSPDFQKEQAFAAQVFQTSVVHAQNQLDQLGKVVPWPQANKMMSSALISLASTRMDPNLAESLARQIQTKDGNSLFDHLDIQEAIKESSRDIYSRQMTMQRMQEEQFTLQQQKIERQTYTDAIQKWQADGSPTTKPLASYFDQSLLADPSTSVGAREALASLNSTWGQMQQAKDAGYSTQDYLDAVTKQAHDLMGIDLKSQQGFAALMDKLTSQGHSDLSRQLSQDRELQWGSSGGTTDKQALGELVQSMYAGTLNQGRLDSAWNNGKGVINTEAYNQLSGDLHSHGPSLEPVDGQLRAELSQAIFQSSGIFNSEMLQKNGLQEAEYQSRLQSASASLYSQSFPLRYDSTITPSQQLGKLKELIPGIVKQFSSPLTGSTPPGTASSSVTPTTPLQRLATDNPLALHFKAVQAAQQLLDNPSLQAALKQGGYSAGSYAPQVSYGLADRVRNGHTALDRMMTTLFGSATVNADDGLPFLLGKLKNLRSQNEPDYGQENQLTSQIQKNFLVNLGPMQDVNDANKILRSFEVHGRLSSVDRMDLVTALTNLQTYAYLKARVPVSISEAKATSNAWQELPLFATPLQFFNHKNEVMQELGLNPNDPKQASQFEAAQLAAIGKMRGQ